MTTEDVNIVTKKILIGFFVFVIPLLIIAGGLAFIKYLSSK